MKIRKPLSSGMILLLFFVLTGTCYGGSPILTVLYSFAGGSDGGTPFGDLTLSGSTLYGMTSEGGDWLCVSGGCGTIFSINTDGSGYRTLHEFGGTRAGDGKTPLGSLILAGSTVYGMTSGGGDTDKGVIFSINTDGSGYKVLHSFGAGPENGMVPYYGALALLGSTLYGATSEGGTLGGGTIFSINTDGSGFKVLHSFERLTVYYTGQEDGSTPYGGLVLSGSALYGMTWSGGNWSNASSGNGTVFSFDTNGNTYTRLHSFGVSPDDNIAGPVGSLTPLGTILYGMTPWGGDGLGGAIFSLNTDGSGFKVLHEFSDYLPREPYEGFYSRGQPHTLGLHHLRNDL